MTRRPPADGYHRARPGTDRDRSSRENDVMPRPAEPLRRSPARTRAALLERDHTVLETVVRPRRPVDPWLTLAPLRHGHGDPTIRSDPSAIWRATRTPAGAATVRLVPTRTDVRVQAWGPGRAWAVEAVPRWLGQEDDAEAFRPTHPLLRELLRRRRGLRFPRTGAVFEALVPAVLEQKVTGFEARASYRALLRRYGDPAPGPVEMRLPPDPRALASTAYHELHPLGLEERRASTLLRVAASAARLEAAGTLPAEDARAALQAVPGVGPWTAAEAARVCFGDPDGVSVGDYHVPRMVCWALAREPRGDDARMLELLEPYRGQRARVVRLIEDAALYPPRRGPRMAGRSIAGI
jgi:3-methyladenine DNA glycosylase/8-oxoguanine DNA glycosylase